MGGVQEETSEAVNYLIKISLWLPQNQINSIKFHTDSAFYQMVIC